MRSLFRGKAALEPLPLKRLFLDDDAERAKLFLTEYPDAVWVETAADCISQLAAHWDEVHLDHDLGGEQYVDVDRDDCGMHVVRWLGFEPRTHLRSTQFFVHSHNGVAATVMVLNLKSMGFRAEAAPFAVGLWKPGARVKPGLVDRLFDWLRSKQRSKD